MKRCNRLDGMTDSLERPIRCTLEHGHEKRNTLCNFEVIEDEVRS